MNLPALDRKGQSLGDGELLARMRADRPDAFASLMRSNNQRLYRLARGFLEDDAEAEEALQESYLRAFVHLDRFRGESSLATWLARIVLNEALGRLRRRRPMVELDGAADTLTPFGAPAPTPEQDIARDEIRRAIERAVGDLPPAFRSVFVMRAVEEMSVEETAACLGIPDNTVKTRFHRANKQLRRALSAQFGALIEGAFPFLGPRCDALVASVLDRLGLPSDAGRWAPFRPD